MSDYAQFFFNSRSSVVQLQLLEISHPSFSQVYHIVRNAAAGVTVTLPDLGPTAFQYYPLRITDKGSSDDLDAGITIDLGDLGTLLPTELDRVAAAGTWSTRPVVRYWTYRSDDLAAPLLGPVLLEVPAISFAQEGATFDAKAPALNVSGTGEQYTFDRFPMLRGLL